MSNAQLTAIRANIGDRAACAKFAAYWERQAALATGAADRAIALRNARICRAGSR